MRGLTLSCENGKSGGVGGLQLKFPPWWGSGYFLETHLVIIPAHKLFKFWTILQYHSRYYCQIPLQVMLLPIQIYNMKGLLYFND